ncbi:sodium:solute symporter family protein [Flavitalea sp.]|nr:sodium:solute symporter [Flavitalea sp.]
MSRFGTIDWIVLVLTLLLIISYGVYKSTTEKNLKGYFQGDRTMPWYVVLLSIMGTQASAVTFLSGPGQAYTDGMRFVQYYFGLPLVMVVVCITFVPVFHRLKIITAYEFLEQRFDLKTRTLTSFLFQLSRSLSTGISIAAPSIILSSLLGWDILWTNMVMGGLVIIYTVTGGAKAVAYTQKAQMIIIILGMFVAGWLVVKLLPESVGFVDALHVSGRLGKLNVITTGVSENGFDWKDRYNIFSGIIGGFFLSLSYFGTDQSQVGRYLAAKNVSESRVGLLMNGLVKVPMQFLILILGTMVFAFYQFNSAPVFFNDVELAKVEKSSYKDSLTVLKKEFELVSLQKQAAVKTFADLPENSPEEQKASDNLIAINKKSDQIRSQVKKIIASDEIKGDGNDANYIFLRFVVDYLPAGLVGLLIAIIILAAWGSIAAALNALASCTIIDFHKRFSKTELTPAREYRLSKLYTLFWGVFCVFIAQFAYNIGNSLIEAVNVLGSLFYGVILGIFLVAFYLKKVGSKAVFLSAVVVELYIILSVIWPWLLSKLPVLGNIVPDVINNFMNSASTIGFLWLNLIGAAGVFILSYLIHLVVGNDKAGRFDLLPDENTAQ